MISVVAAIWPGKLLQRSLHMSQQIPYCYSGALPHAHLFLDIVIHLCLTNSNLHPRQCTHTPWPRGSGERCVFKHSNAYKCVVVWLIGVLAWSWVCWVNTADYPSDIFKSCLASFTHWGVHLQCNMDVWVHSPICHACTFSSPTSIWYLSKWKSKWECAIVFLSWIFTCAYMYMYEPG